MSDRCAAGAQEDASGPALVEILTSWGWPPEVQEVLPDEEHEIAERIAGFATGGFDLVVTTGGTGLGPRDRTPEATLRVADRLVPGIAEMIRSRTGAAFPRAYLSRGVAVTRDRCLIVNLPGSPAGARDGLNALREILPHALAVLREAPGEPSAHDGRGGQEGGPNRS